MKASKKVAELIKFLNSLASNIASASEQQSVAVSEVSKTVDNVRMSTQTLNKNINQVAHLSKQMLGVITSFWRFAEASSFESSQTSQHITQVDSLVSRLNLLVTSYKVN